MIKTESEKLTEEQIRECISPKFQESLGSIERMRSLLVQNELCDALADSLLSTHQKFRGEMHGPTKIIDGQEMILTVLWRPYSEYKNSI